MNEINRRKTWTLRPQPRDNLAAKPVSWLASPIRACRPGQGQYLVMDFVEGEDLQAMLDRFDLLPEPQVLTWISQICDALAYLHSQPSPIIHRDSSPPTSRFAPTAG